MEKFNPQSYWEERLEENFNLHGVGDISLGVNYNNYLYKIRKYAFHKVMKRLKVNFTDKAILDIGSGTGFYIERWKELHVKSITGSDFTNVVVKNLSERFPDSRFIQMDAGEKIQDPQPQYDFISAFDVLFHIVEDERFDQAIKNIHGLLNEQGYFVISDNFIHGDTQRIKHQVSRSYEYMMNVIQSTGFKPVATVPMFVLMNDPVDTKSRVMRKIFWIITKTVRKGEGWGKFVGSMLTPFEKLLISLKTESPSTEIRVFQKVK
ncbi:MAG: class I SAM-dependent methyltransferase [Flavobacteriales bacterium]|nr:class I SAM-dependent methyltransferase [Flavobacteriales bacterium]